MHTILGNRPCNSGTSTNWVDISHVLSDLIYYKYIVSMGINQTAQKMAIPYHTGTAPRNAELMPSGEKRHSASPTSISIHPTVSFLLTTLRAQATYYGGLPAT